jgi:malonyl CoA-acyl carrier protein transacylase
MGADLFDRFADWTSEADEILGFSIRDLCVDDAADTLGLTTFTQPALYVVNAMTHRAKREDGAAAPAFVAGHSLGEYNALLAAEVFDFGTGLRLVKHRGELMGEVSGGGMAAVIGLDPGRIESVLADSDAGRRLDVANFNTFDQTVIAGPKDDLADVKSSLIDAGARTYIPLNVSAPFHSRYMADSAASFAGFIEAEASTFRPPTLPVISNVTAKPYAPDAIADTLARQIDHSVKWLDSMVYLLDQGVTDFEEVGPGNVLGKMLVKIRRHRKNS